ncbi:MAG: bifunctional UDP-sugar hydrolase/5'-nucleotidase [Proteobacteria bacterium]|nr:bifunctional UDP-sugar hydrolase/5'-nucleotidase [Pseudomonadota bacterium]
MRGRLAVACVVLFGSACTEPAREARTVRPPPVRKTGAVTLSIVGTNDLHGALERLPLLAGFVSNLRAARAADGGGVLLVDAGDMFQGTLESNINEGADVVAAYNAMGYQAAVIGNHEFDFGPEGPAVTAKSIEEDPRGALKARAAEAKFPILATNVFDARSNARIKWPNMVGSVVVDVAGVKVGIVGASTESTPFTTMPANFLGLKIAPPAIAIAAEAKMLRDEGATVIVVAAHLGSKCTDLSHPTDTSSCDRGEELFKMIADLPKGMVDVIVAGHTHAAVAHRIDDISVIESYSSGRAFGRIDLRISDGHVTSTRIQQPHELCPRPLDPKGTPDKENDRDGTPVAVADCRPGDYEGKPVIPDPVVQKIVDASLAKAGERRAQPLGVTLTKPVTRSYGTESAEGNLFCDLMLAAQPTAEVAMTNGGGLRADIPGGALTYGRLFEAMPFDNRFALVDVKGSHLRRLVTTNLQRNGGIFSWGGLTAKARCVAGKLDVQIAVKGKPLADHAAYKLVTSDFLASGGDGVVGRLKLPDGAIQPTDVIIRDAMADVLRKQGGTLDPASYFSPLKKRLDYEGQRPVSCGGAGATPSTQEPD